MRNRYGRIDLDRHMIHLLKLILRLLLWFSIGYLPIILVFLLLRQAQECVLFEIIYVHLVKILLACAIESVLLYRNVTSPSRCSLQQVLRHLHLLLLFRRFLNLNLDASCCVLVRVVLVHNLVDW